MPGFPNEYRPDPTEGITRVEDLPKPNISCRSRNFRRRPCPRCGHSSYRDRGFRRPLSHDFSDTPTRTATRPGRALLTALLYPLSQVLQRRHDGSGRAPAVTTREARQVDNAPSAWIIEDGLPYRTASWNLQARASRVRPLRHDPELGRGRGKAGKDEHRRRLPRRWAAADPDLLPGYIAADELADGPFCILSIVDNRSPGRLAYKVLDHAATGPDVVAFFRHFHAALVAARG